MPETGLDARKLRMAAGPVWGDDQGGKLGGDTDLMGAALLLASDAGRYITGSVIVIDGGQSAAL